MNKHPLTVLHIIAGFALEGPLGGIERFGIQLAQAFDRSRVRPIVCGLWHFGTDYEQEWVTHLQRQGISAFIAAHWQAEHPYRAFQQAVCGMITRNRRADIIHSHYEFGDIAAMLIKHTWGAKYIIRTVHNEREWPKRPLRRWLLTHGLWVVLFDHELGVSRQVVANLNARPLARLFRKRAKVAYNGIDFSRFEQSPYTRQDIERMWEIPSSSPLLISVGRLTEQKGYNVLLEAMQHVVRTRRDVHLLLIGTGPLEGALYTQAKRLGISRHVHLVGVRRDVERLLPLADVFVSSSLWEGLATAILEACAAKVPVVATRVSGTTEVIASDEMGVLVPPGQPKPLSEAILYLLEHQTEARRMAERAYKHARAHFSIEAIARQYEAVYFELWSRRGKRRI